MRPVSLYLTALRGIPKVSIKTKKELVRAKGKRPNSDREVVAGLVGGYVNITKVCRVRKPVAGANFRDLA